MAKLSRRKETGRWFGEFRDYADVLRPDDWIKPRTALVPKGEKVATTDRVVAQALFAEILKELEQRRRTHGLTGQKGARPRLAAYAKRHLERKAVEPRRKGNGPVTDLWLLQSERHLRVAVEFFGPDRELASIETDDVDRWVDHLRTLDNGRGGTLTDTSVRKYLNTLSNLFRRAVSEKRETGVMSNPVAAMFSKPTEEKREAEFLTASEAALLLEAARTYRPAVGPVPQAHGGTISPDAFPWIYPLLATFLLTGGRKSEILGLEVDDVSFHLDRIFIRPNQWRRLKTPGSHREVPLWPQLKEILGEYTVAREREGGLGSLLFPSGRGEEERMIRDMRKALDRIGTRAGFPQGHVRLHMLRHTYTAARIQTMDRGAPVAMYTVARELGHRGEDLIRERYGHLHSRASTESAELDRLHESAIKEDDAARRETMRAQIRAMKAAMEVVEFRAEHHRAAMPDRFEALTVED